MNKTWKDYDKWDVVLEKIKKASPDIYGKYQDTFDLLEARENEDREIEIVYPWGFNGEDSAFTDVKEAVYDVMCKIAADSPEVSLITPFMKVLSIIDNNAANEPVVPESMVTIVSTPVSNCTGLVNLESGAFVKLVIYETGYFYRIAFMDSMGRYHCVRYLRKPLIGIPEDEISELREDYPDEEAEVLFYRRLKGLFSQTENEYKKMEECLKIFSVIKPLTAPEEVLEDLDENDYYGLFDKWGAWWRFDSKNRNLHIYGHGAVEGNLWSEEGIEWYDEETGHLNKLIVHEGITSFQMRDETDVREIYDNFYIDSVELPSTLESFPKMNCYVNKMVIPESVKGGVRLCDDLAVVIRGHFDPISYAAKSLWLPSTMKLVVGELSEFSLAEPVSHWEELVLYGDDPIPESEIDNWLESNIFYLDIQIKYPAKWDEGQTESYAKRILNLIKKKEPEKLTKIVFFDNSTWEKWDDEDYEKFLKRMVSY